METYLLITTVAIFIGVMSLIWFADYKRRANSEQFLQISQVLNEALKTLQGIHATNYEHLNESKESVVQSRIELKACVQDLQKTVLDATESINSSAKSVNEAVRADVRNSIEKLSSALLTATGAISRTNHELKTELVYGVKSVSDGIARTNRDLTTAVLKEVSAVTKQIEELRRSLEESIKF
jgi:hypothetical protein